MKTSRLVLGVNIFFILVFIFLLFYSLFSLPFSARVPKLWMDEFQYIDWQDAQNTGHWYIDQDADVNVSISSGKITISQFNTTGYTWICYNIIENVTNPITDWEIEARVRWNDGIGHHTIGIQSNGRESRYRLGLNGWDKEFSLLKGDKPIYIPPMIYQPTAGWHIFTLKQRDSVFQIFYDRALLGEALGPVGIMPLTKILVGSGYDSSSEFEYVKLTYFEVEEIEENKNYLSIFAIIIVAGALGTSLLNYKNHSYAMIAVPAFACALYIGMISIKVFGENGISLGVGDLAKLVQWLISIFLTIIIFFISNVLMKKQQQK